MVCIIVIYLISIVASPALIKTVAPCRRLYCKPVWSFVFPSPPLVFGLSGSVMFTCTVSLNTLLFSQFFLFSSHPEIRVHPPRYFSSRSFVETRFFLRGSEGSIHSRLLSLWWLLKLILNLKNKKREHGNFSKWNSEEVLGINQTPLDYFIVAWRETDRV